MRFYYVNSKGERLNFYDHPYLFQEGTLLDYSWSYETASGSRTFLKNVRHGATERKFKLALLPDYRWNAHFHNDWEHREKMKKLQKAAEHVFEVFEYDVLNDQDGELHTDTGFYLPCRIVASSKSDWMNGLTYMFQEYTVVSTFGVWIGEKEKSFTASLDASADGQDYPYDYKYDYARTADISMVWNTGALTDSDFLLTIYGPCMNPTVTINSAPHTVYASVGEGEKLLIDSRDCTVHKITPAGTSINMFDLRSKVYSVFTKIPPDAMFVWNGSFAFDCKIFAERSEPTWIKTEYPEYSWP